MKERVMRNGMAVKFDDADYLTFQKYKMTAVKNGPHYYARIYIFKEKGKKMIPLPVHRILMNADDPNTIVDHKDGDSLNNQRGNLRLCTNQQNSWNKRKFKGSTSKYKGVCVKKTLPNKFYSYIDIKGSKHHLGCFDDELSAARAYNAAAKIYHGEFARLNLV